RAVGDPRYVPSDETSHEILRVWTEFTIVELLRNGITTFVEFGARAHVQQALAQALGRLGIRGYLGAGYNVGRWVGGENGRLERVVDEAGGAALFDEAIAFVKDIDGRYDGRARGLLCP